MLKNLPANTGNMGSIPSLRRSHVLRGKKALVPQLLSLCSQAVQLPSPCSTTTKAHALQSLCPQEQSCNKKPAHHNQTVVPAHQNERKARAAMSKINK